MKPSRLLVLLLLLPACAHLDVLRGERPEHERLWDAAHQSLDARDFARAEAAFKRISTGFPGSVAGRESAFYLGAIRLDPRNPEWDPQPAQKHLTAYLAADSAKPGTVYRRPEAQMLLELARQLTMPAEERVPGLQPETRVVTREVTPQRVVASARENRALANEVASLKKQVAERDATIQQQKEELERIRKTLTGKR